MRFACIVAAGAAVLGRVPAAAQDAPALEFVFEEPFYSCVCNLALFNDPAGNALILHQRHKPYSDGSLP